MKEGKNCYECKFRGTVPGSAHSSCRIMKEIFPEEESASKMEFLVASGAYMMNFKDRTTGVNTPIVKLNEHGVKNGWAAWPLNFDPIWVEDCVTFKEKE